jgi:hypothetical protein
MTIREAAAVRRKGREEEEEAIIIEELPDLLEEKIKTVTEGLIDHYAAKLRRLQ